MHLYRLVFLKEDPRNILEPLNDGISQFLIGATTFPLVLALEYDHNIGGFQRHRVGRYFGRTCFAYHHFHLVELTNQARGLHGSLQALLQGSARWQNTFKNKIAFL